MDRSSNLISQRFKKLLTYLLVLLGVNQSCFAQSLETDSVNKKRLSTLIVGTSTAYTATMIGLHQVWYSSFDKQPFTFFNDSKEWFQMDKAGHAYSTFQISQFGSNALQWTGLSKKKSDRIAVLSSFIMVSSIEMFDGYSTGYGASASDLIANALGGSLYLGQQMLWNEIRIHPKFSFHQTNLANQRPALLGSNLGQEIIKDYNGQTYWLSFDMDKFTPFPKWLNLAIGYGGHEMVYANKEEGIANGYAPYRQLYFSIDFDLTGVRTNSRGIKALLYIANMIKLPSPTLEISQGRLKSHAFYF